MSSLCAPRTPQLQVLELTLTMIHGEGADLNEALVSRIESEQ